MTNFWQGLESFNSEDTSPSKIEFKLYYDDNGLPLFYSTENENGNYIVIDHETYSRGDYNNIKVKDGKILQRSPLDSTKLIKSDTEGVSCHKNDVSIIEDTNTGQYWKLKTYEYR